MPDITVRVTSDDTSSERRISPEWTICHLKSRLELITGIPPENQHLLVYLSPVATDPVSPSNDSATVSSLEISDNGQIHVKDTREASERINFHDISEVDKYEMPKEQYEQLNNTVLAWKKDKLLGRFNPDHDKVLEAIERASHFHVEIKGIEIGKRCMANGRKGSVKYVGVVPEIPAKTAPNKLWVGVAFDEPVGKNDGSIKGKRYFETSPNYGSFISPELLEVGDFPPDDYLDDEDEL